MKLEAALTEFAIDPAGYVCIDIGSSTGGFTDCLLQHGAEKVVAIDAGTNQLVWSLRIDPRVEVREKTNARDLTPVDFREQFDLAVMDVSFISVTKVMPAIITLLKPNGRMVILIKPQFEVGRGEVGKGGIVREPEKHQSVIAEVNAFAESMGLNIGGLIESPILGPKETRSFLCCMQQAKSKSDAEENQTFVEGLDFYFEDGLMVLTRRYLAGRGYCCDNGCRHCPYDQEPVVESE